MNSTTISPDASPALSSRESSTPPNPHSDFYSSDHVPKSPRSPSPSSYLGSLPSPTDPSLTSLTRALYSRLANNVPKKENKGEEKDKTWHIFVGEPTKLISVSEFLENCMRTLEAETEISVEEESMGMNNAFSNLWLYINQICDLGGLGFLMVSGEVQEHLKTSTSFFADATLFYLLREHHSLHDDDIGQSGQSEGGLRKRSRGGGGEKEGNERRKEKKLKRVPPAVAAVIRVENNLGSLSTSESDIVSTSICIPTAATTNNTNTATFSPTTLGQSRATSHTNSSTLPTSIGSLVLPPLSSTADNNTNFSEEGTVSTSTHVGNRVAEDQRGMTVNNSTNGAITTITSGPTRPKPTSLELQFWEMAGMLDNSILASLKEENRVKLEKKRPDLNFVSTEKARISTHQTLPITKPEVVLSVAFYDHHNPASRMQEFLVLGSQPLTALKDAFYCLKDFYSAETEKSASSYFLIENTFYNDLRDEGVQDYSKTIIDWLSHQSEETKAKLGPYRSNTMHETKFEELTIRLNQPYLFCHRGDCQHALIFRDLRLLHDGDEQDYNAYPKAVFRCKISRSKCKMCLQRPAQFTTLNDYLSGECPAYFCETCYNQFHYDENGTLLYDSFQVFPYVHE
ncbi:8635_t:CDS:10 [Paraglomus brasilianum]|uniref:8635_t:CDS:1 n=1 Tax=Paraglomus brasilianum TaxID=144538 RepID=A0A9N9BRK0_9GLOM|nr:8635_t:CDS:10 [Paraglomus brasilianum]